VLQWPKPFFNNQRVESEQFPVIKVRTRASSVVGIGKESQEESETPADSLVQDRLMADVMMSEIDTFSAVDLDDDGEDGLSELSEDGKDL